MSDKRVYFLVIYDNEKKAKGDALALKSIITEQSASILFSDPGATITRKECGNSYTITTKRVFEYVNTDGTKTTFIVADADKKRK